MLTFLQGAHEKCAPSKQKPCQTEACDHFILTQLPFTTENTIRFQGSTMPRVLLIIALLAAQLISWSASPLFLCFDSDGEVCIDLGPGSCNCCRHEHEPVNDQGRPEHRIGGSPCDCTHLQITVPWTVVTVASDATRLVRLSSLTPFVADDEIGRSLTPKLQDSPLTVNRDVRCCERGARTAILRC